MVQDKTKNNKGKEIIKLGEYLVPILYVNVWHHIYVNKTLVFVTGKELQKLSIMGEVHGAFR